MTANSVIVVSKIVPEDLEWQLDGTTPIVSDDEGRLDALDEFNHPRIRRGYILKALQMQAQVVRFEKQIAGDQVDFGSYGDVHSPGLLEFLRTAWQRWSDLGENGRDPLTSWKWDAIAIPALVPGVVPLPRDPHQRPSRNVMGQVGYYCTDVVTPIFAGLLEEMNQDVAIIHRGLDLLLVEKTDSVVFCLPTHPGHHSAQDSFGGYCYLNHSAHAARQLHTRLNHSKVAVLDVDYHCGNGTASIFYDDPNILVVSIHCHPEYDYPFHSGYEDENKEGLMHVPLLPGATWDDHYRPALQKAVDHIFDQFGAQALVVSLGLDTLDGDPVALKRAGFALKPPEYTSIGNMIGSKLPPHAPCLVVQEGGYKMTEVGTAAANLITGIAAGRS